MKRRQFLEACGLSAAACWYPALVSAAEPRSRQIAPGRSVKADVLIVGGGLGGCEAAGALAAFCTADREPPRQIRHEPKRLERYQAMLVARGVELDWDRLAEL